ncbi:MAG TPA: helix-turn-helix domain-containing protein [Acidimicrobiales bacterium]|nr:helix-turn-helix domain-containing protein [Acidimicrobiales bacterium]
MASASVDVRPQRADARRNYEKLVEAARDLFDEEGDTSMEAIAKRAGVGIGTLYRHFPKRIDVVEAVYRDDVEQVVAVAERAAATLGPWEAVDSFLRAFVTYALGKRRFLNELREAFEKNPSLKSSARERLDYAMHLVVDRGQAAGVVRSDLAGDDVLSLVGPMCMSATLSREQAERLLGMILDGLRAPAV